MLLGMLLCVFTVYAIAHTGTRYSLLETLAVLLLAMRLFTIASFEMALALIAAVTTSEVGRACHVYTAQGRRLF